MSISALVFGMAIGAIMAFVGQWLREKKEVHKYCPTCGRMLLVCEKELEKKDVNE